MRGKQLQGFCSAGCDQDLAPTFLQQHLAPFKAIQFVIDTQNYRSSRHGTPPIFAGQAHEELALASFSGAAPPYSEHDLYQTRKAQRSRALDLERTWKCKHYLVTPDTETSKNIALASDRKASSGNQKFGMPPFCVNACGSLCI